MPATIGGQSTNAITQSGNQGKELFATVVADGDEFQALQQRTGKRRRRGSGENIAARFLHQPLDHARIAEFRAQLGDASERLELRKCDVGNYAQVEALFRELEGVLTGGVQIVVNNSGIRKDAVLAMMKPEDWDDVLRVNLSGTFNVSKFAVLASSTVCISSATHGTSKISASVSTVLRLLSRAFDQLMLLNSWGLGGGRSIELPGILKGEY